MSDHVIEDVVPTAVTAYPTRTSDAVAASLKRRYASEKRFRAYGIAAIGIAVAALVILFVNIIGTGLPAFRQTMIHLPVTLEPAAIDPSG
ncbi:MAG: DUF3333 domain-containing protein, partial [Hyphomicrobium sp.]